MLTPDQAQDLVAHFGSQRAAAHGVGMVRSTLRAWLHPEKHRESSRKWREANPEKAREAHKSYYEANSEKVCEAVAKYRATLEGAISQMRAEQNRKSRHLEEVIKNGYV